jgi:hypothetical protein
VTTCEVHEYNFWKFMKKDAFRVTHPRYSYV